MHISQLKKSNFLTKDECDPAILVTIRSIGQENVAKEGADEELKYVLHFAEDIKPMVLNSTNGQIIAKIVNSEETDNWTGHKIVLYKDDNISFGGKMVGGIRARAPRVARPAPAAAAAPAPTPAPAPKPSEKNWAPENTAPAPRAAAPAFDAADDDMPF